MLIWSKEIADELDKIESIRPCGLANRVSTYLVVQDKFTKSQKDIMTGLFVTFDFNTDHSEYLLIHQQGGGGYLGIIFLIHLELLPTIANIVINRIISLGPDYDAIHIRNTDYQTDYKKLFQKTAKMFKERHLLVCTDDTRVFENAKKVYSPSTKIHTVSNIPELNGRPIHKVVDDPQQHVTNFDLLSDLFAMALAKRFVFVKLSTSRKPHYSGFSTLANNLNKNSKIIYWMLRSAKPELQHQISGLNRKKQTFASGKNSFHSNLVYTLRQIDFWYWNFNLRRELRSLKLRVIIRSLHSKGL